MADIDSVLEGVNLVNVGERSVGHVGPVEYRYGRTAHPPCPYPNNDALENIFEKIREHLGDADITKENYCTLITLYKDGSNHLPFHCDNEPCIAPDSNIITVSFGATRTIEFRSIKGQRPTRMTHHLPHGSVHVMSRESQEYWEHRIPALEEHQPSDGQRLSLTLRRLVSTTPHIIPPIKEPEQPPPPPPVEYLTSNTAAPKRVLFLSDSIHLSFPTNIFADPKEIECIKKECYELHTIEKYENEFGYTDMVFISCGINDLSRHGHQWDAANLVNFLRNKLIEWKTKFPNTIFIFNSLLLTRFKWLNIQVNKYNELLFDLTLKFYESEVLFYDSWHVAAGLWSQGDFIVKPKYGNGIHITFTSKKVIQGTMYCCITELLTGQHMQQLARCWPLRERFRAHARAIGSLLN